MASVNIVVYVGSDHLAKEFKEDVKQIAKGKGHINRKGEPIAAPFVLESVIKNMPASKRGKYAGLIAAPRRLDARSL